MRARTDAAASLRSVDATVAAALAGSAAASAAVPEPDGGAAGLAWRWVVRTDALDLYAADAAADDWRATCLGAGAALHRARVALAAEGLASGVTMIPDSCVTGHLARLVTTGRVAVTSPARELFDATGSGPEATARRRAVWRALGRRLVAASRAEGVRLRMLADGRGLIGVLHGTDAREGWLRAGSALSVVRLSARRHGVQTVTAVCVTDDGTLSPRARRRLGDREGWLEVGIGTPYARLRVRPAPID